MGINSVSISGNIGSDAQLRQTAAGTAVASFSVAVNERVRDASGEWSDYANWVDCVMFGNRAAALAPYLAKGAKVAVSGRLHVGSYERDGQRRKSFEVRVDEVDLLSSKGGGSEAARPASAPTCTNAYQRVPSGGDLYAEDIPF